jgi:hypothetical protein
MSRKIDFSKRSLPDQFIECVVSNMTKVWREEFSGGGSSSDLNFRKRLVELTRGVLNKSWQAVGDLYQQPFILISEEASTLPRDLEENFCAYLVPLLL